jgi:hypothetical protein
MFRINTYEKQGEGVRPVNFQLSTVNSKAGGFGRTLARSTPALWTL